MCQRHIKHTSDQSIQKSSHLGVCLLTCLCSGSPKKYKYTSFLLKISRFFLLMWVLINQKFQYRKSFSPTEKRHPATLVAFTHYGGDDVSLVAQWLWRLPGYHPPLPPVQVGLFNKQEHRNSEIQNKYICHQRNTKQILIQILWPLSTHPCHQ